jgi:hypothetical protein
MLGIVEIEIISSLLRVGVKALPFLTGVTFLYTICKVFEGRLNAELSSITSVPSLSSTGPLTLCSFLEE